MALEIKDTLLAQVLPTGIEPSRVLEVGGVAGPKSLLDGPESPAPSTFVLNIAEVKAQPGVTNVLANANDMPFADASFDLVMSVSTLEHDKHFWLSLAEMKRVLRPGGVLAIAVPGYVKDPERDRGRWTRTYRVHFAFDYYRFSEQAVERGLLRGDGADRDRAALLIPPRIIGHAVQALRTEQGAQ